MKFIDVSCLPAVSSVCDQIFRKLERQPDWSMTHVLMNPFESSLLHRHRGMKQIYIITKGYGVLDTGIENPGGTSQFVTAGNVVVIQEGTSHKLENLGAGMLEHLVICWPPSDPADSELVEVPLVPGYRFQTKDIPVRFPLSQIGFDGSHVFTYEFAGIDLSVAFGQIAAIAEKKHHYHKKSNEWLYVAEGRGDMGNDIAPMQAGQWWHLEPGDRHGFRSTRNEHLIVVFVCQPKFSKNDVFWD